ncbi:uncharacterized protein LOC129588323 [Paramacrobiotus metropolitanus]|uniref:uncharacterized protein LOC129588323 n=1 Tax=Paramacrobiotus metropolitanus TaxID=2943436 RepID=UPI002445ED59|nr:uncharacterized protein LOC129588323 [Paramacrobiotus metropolitanus]
MKFAVVLLFAFLAVSNAAFTGNLVQQAQPLLRQALFKVRLASRADTTGTLVEQLQNHANEIMNQISTAIATGQAVAESVVDDLQETLATLQSMGQSVLSSATDVISNFLGGLWGSIFGKSRSLAGVVDFIQNFDINAVIDQIIGHAQDLVSQLDLQSLLQNAIAALFGRGFFGDVISQIQAAGEQAWSQITNIISQVTTVAGSAFEQVQALAQSFVSEAAVNIQSMTSQAAAEFLNFLKPYAQQLGGLYEQVQAQLSGLLN